MSVRHAYEVPAHSTRGPERLLLLTGTMGEGHNGPARALEQAARAMWPDCVIETVDVLDRMGPGAGPSLRGTYVANVQATPWLYELYFTSIHRLGWFARTSKWVVGMWAAPGLSGVIDRFQPDLIVSTHHMASAALATLRRRGELPMPAATWVADFAPHPLWLFPDADLTFVLSEASARSARKMEPEAEVRVAAPPVRDAFGPGDRRAARSALGWGADEYVLLLSAGSYGFGEIDQTVDTLLAATEDPGGAEAGNAGAEPGRTAGGEAAARIVVVCGRNARLAARLRARGLPPERLTVRDWVDDMAVHLQAADAVITNGGCSTALEALTCGRAVVMYRPIAAHGRANASLFAEAGLAAYPSDARELTETIQSLRTPTVRARYERAARTYADERARTDDLQALAELL